MLPISLFKYSRLLRVEEGDGVRLVASRVVSRSSINYVVLILDSGAILICRFRLNDQTLIKQIDVPSDNELDNDKKHVEVLCISPCGQWALLAVKCGAIYVIPVGALWLNDNDVSDREQEEERCSFSRDDAKLIPPGHHTIQPSAIAWWRTRTSDYAVLGTKQGEIEFIDLLSGQRVGGTYIRNAIAQLDIYKDGPKNELYLLITSDEQDGRHWRLLLEQLNTGWCFPLDNSPTASQHESETTSVEAVRSKLIGLKQLSFDKFTALQTKLNEKKQILFNKKSSEAASTSTAAATSLSSSTLLPSYRQSIDKPVSSLSSSRSRVTAPTSSSSSSKPECLINLLGDGLQWINVVESKLGQLLCCYYNEQSLLHVHLPDLELVQLSIHKLPSSLGIVLVTDTVIYLTNSDFNRLTLLSYNYSETNMDMKKFNEDSLLSIYELDDDKERIVDVLSHYSVIPSVSSDIQRILGEKIKQSQINGCIIVTNRGLIECSPIYSPEGALIELARSNYNMSVIGKLESLFTLPAAKLYEAVGDMKLEEREFTQAIAYYRSIKKSHLAVVQKFATLGHSSLQLLQYTTILLSGVNEGLLMSERKKLSNMALAAYVEVILRNFCYRTETYMNFKKFLESNIHYDSNLAMKLCFDARLWPNVEYLLKQRCSHSRLLQCIIESDRTIASLCSDAHQEHRIICDYRLSSILFAHPHYAALYVIRLSELIPHLSLNVLRQAAKLTNPFQPELRPVIHPLLDTGSSHIIADDDITRRNGDDGGSMAALQPEDLIDLHVHILLYIINKTGVVQMKNALQLTSSSSIEQQSNSSAARVSRDVLPPKLSAGFTHAGLCRDGQLILWGENNFNCVGDCDEPNQDIQLPICIDYFIKMGISVEDVACGRTHTLALTSNGVYAWGSSKYGQIGVGLNRNGRCPYPHLVKKLAHKSIRSVACGQYHSLAVTHDGQLYTWGWNLFGQLGLGSIEDHSVPRLVRIQSYKVHSADAGYAHSCALTTTGDVFVFGCSSYGQLGNGSFTKSTLPIIVDLLEPAIEITCGYFHTLTILENGDLYRWGSDPQSLRPTGLAQRKRDMLAAVCDKQITATRNGDETSTPLVDDEEVGAKRSDCTLNLLDRFNGNSSVANQDMLQNRSGVKISVTESSPLQRKTNVPPYSKTPLRNSLPPINSAVSSENIQTSHLWPSRIALEQVVEGRVVQIAAGAQHSALITDTGQLYTWGRNLDGQLGVGGRQESQLPQLCQCFPDDCFPINVVCGSDSTLVLTSDGSLYGCGSNAYGQLGWQPMPDKLDDSKLILLKNRRLLRLQQSHNAVERFQKLDNVPQQLTRNNNRLVELNYDIKSDCNCLIHKEDLDSIKRKSKLTESERLCIVLELFRGCYKSSQLIEKCVQLDNYYVAAKVCALNDQYARAVGYHLRAVAAEVIEQNVNSNEVQLDFYSDLVQLNVNNDQDQISVNNDQDQISVNNNEDQLNGNNNHDNLLIDRLTPSLIDNYLNFSSSQESRSSVSDSIVLRQVLYQIMLFWLEKQLPVAELERLLEPRLERLAYSLSVLLFASSTSDDTSEQLSNNELRNIFSGLSNSFCMRLCSILFEQISSGSNVGSEFIPLLTELVFENDNSYNDTLDDDTIMDVIIYQLLSYRDCSLIQLSNTDLQNLLVIGHRNNGSAHTSSSVIDSADNEIVAFTCGHSFLSAKFYTEIIPHLRSGLSSLPHSIPRTSELLLKQYEDLPSCCQCACPLCVLDYVSKYVTSSSSQELQT